MEIVITQWALDSYLDMKHSQVFSDHEYHKQIRPDVLKLKNQANETKFKNSKFWSIATDTSSNRVPNGYKMKWHQIGNGKVQLRLPVGLFSQEAFLCEAYVKSNDKKDKRMIARFKVHLELIRKGRYTESGRLI